MDNPPNNHLAEAVPVPQRFEDNDEIPPLLSTSMMEFQEQLTSVKENSYRNLDAVKRIMRNKIQVFNEPENLGSYLLGRSSKINVSKQQNFLKMFLFSQLKDLFF